MLFVSLCNLQIDHQVGMKNKTTFKITVNHQVPQLLRTNTFLRVPVMVLQSMFLFLSGAGEGDINDSRSNATTVCIPVRKGSM